jgi:thymidylate synthase (FAD)
MKNIEIGIINYDVSNMTRVMMGVAARLTQKGHDIHSIADLGKLVNPPPSDKMIETLCELPHPTLQKFDLLQIAFVGVSRRFLAQITRHQDIKFMSSSMHYGDHSDASFVTPYEIIEMEGTEVAQDYAAANRIALGKYQEAVKKIGTDAAGYLLPNSTRVTLLAAASPFEWKHIINQRVCNRNCKEIQYVMLKVWEALYTVDPVLYGNTCAPDCWQGCCREGKMRCEHKTFWPAFDLNPTAIIAAKFPKI